MKFLARMRIKTFLAGGLVMLALVSAAMGGALEDGQAAYQQADYETAERLWRPLADLGDARGQSNLGAMYANGRRVPQDDAQAVGWFRKAADKGDARSR
jgi:uncharacterized protein